MKNKVKINRVISNILFYIFYVFIISIIFTFIFPLLQMSLGQSIWLPNDPKFSVIQIAIVILVLIFSLIFRKYFYLPIK